MALEDTELNVGGVKLTGVYIALVRRWLVQLVALFGQPAVCMAASKVWRTIKFQKIGSYQLRHK